MGRIWLSPASKRDLKAIWKFVAQNNLPAADALINSIYSKLGLLCDFPHAGPARPQLGRSLRSFPVGSYLIFYRPIRGGIQLIRVIHGSRNLLEVFKRR
jgi:toxin ParE1/3/4